MNKIVLGIVLGVIAVAAIVGIVVMTISPISDDKTGIVYPKEGDAYYEQFMEELPAKGENWDIMVREFESRYMQYTT